MIPIEHVLVMLLAIFGLVGLSRRFPLEFGATVGFVAMLLMLDLADRYLPGLLLRTAASIGLAQQPELALWMLYSLTILGWVAFLYIGQTLRFSGVWPPGRVVGAGLDLATGLLNGWLVIGSWWHYTDRLGYPIQRFGLFVPPLSARAEQLLRLTPQALIPDQYSVVALGGLLVALILLRVIR